VGAVALAGVRRGVRERGGASGRRRGRGLGGARAGAGGAMTLLVFGAVFLAYLRALPPCLAPWRDTGEMAWSSWSLGVAHPTGYPLYLLLGRLAASIPLGNFAYRLNVLSAAAGAAAVALLFSSVRRRAGLWPALAAAGWLAFNAAFWTVSQVSEMYSLWILCAIGLMLAAGAVSEAGGERLWPAFCFLAGVLLGNRLDLLLWAPGLLWLALAARPGVPGEDGLWAGVALLLFPAIDVMTGSNFPFAALIVLTVLWRARGPGMARRTALAAAAGAAGLSIYLYLPVRSATGPLLDWNHPALAANFADSILRTRYGGTLDLISRNYATGQLFGDNLRLWGAHLWDAFGPAGLAAALIGCAVGFRDDRRRWLGRAACWWWSGPVFLFLANLPPNPHAAAIIEPHYLLSDAALLFWAADGAAALAGASRALAPLLAAAALAWPLWRGVPARQDRREHLADLDFAKNVFRAAPPGAVVVAKKDVQLYALWHAQGVLGLRPDLKVVAEGLSGAQWYQADWRRRDPDLAVSSLSVAEGWAALSAGGRPVLATQDAELPPATAAMARPRGLLLAVSPGAPPDDGGQWDLLVRRGTQHYGEPPDFFTSDLIEETAQASYREGIELQKRGRGADAERRLNDAWRTEWLFPDVPYFLGYMAAVGSRWSESEAYGALSDGLFARKLALAADYRTLPGLLGNLRRQAAEASTQHGVALDKLGEREEAEAAYRRALSLAPIAQAHYDLAVLYWGRDPRVVAENLQEALRLDPGHAAARAALAKLRLRP
jgi:tetratricopeptide (TPR) repeat protein